LRLPAASYVLGGVAVLALASFAGFAAAGEAAQSCAPGCSSGQVASLRRDYLVADASLVAALAAAGGAVFFALTSSGVEEPAAPASAGRSAGWWLGMRVDGAGPSLGAGTSF